MSGILRQGCRQSPESLSDSNPPGIGTPPGGSAVLGNQPQLIPRCESYLFRMPGSECCASPMGTYGERVIDTFKSQTCTTQAEVYIFQITAKVLVERSHSFCIFAIEFALRSSTDVVARCFAVRFPGRAQSVHLRTTRIH